MMIMQPVVVVVVVVVVVLVLFGRKPLVLVGRHVVAWLVSSLPCRRTVDTPPSPAA